MEPPLCGVTESLALSCSASPLSVESSAARGASWAAVAAHFATLSCHLCRLGLPSCLCHVHCPLSVLAPLWEGASSGCLCSAVLDTLVWPFFTSGNENQSVDALRQLRGDAQTRCRRVPGVRLYSGKVWFFTFLCSSSTWEQHCAL